MLGERRKKEEEAGFFFFILICILQSLNLEGKRRKLVSLVYVFRVARSSKSSFKLDHSVWKVPHTSCFLCIWLCGSQLLLLFTHTVVSGYNNDTYFYNITLVFKVILCCYLLQIMEEHHFFS